MCAKRTIIQHLPKQYFCLAEMLLAIRCFINIKSQTFFARNICPLLCLFACFVCEQIKVYLYLEDYYS